MLRRKYVKLGVIVLGVSLAVALGGVGGLMAYIHNSTRQVCAQAQLVHPHPGDDVAALVETMNGEQHSFKKRNMAVWALGRLADPAALPALTAVYTGQRCDHEKSLCQYELEKAIRRCGATPDPPRAVSHP